MAAWWCQPEVLPGAVRVSPIQTPGWASTSRRSMPGVWVVSGVWSDGGTSRMGSADGADGADGAAVDVMGGLPSPALYRAATPPGPRRDPAGTPPGPPSGAARGGHPAPRSEGLVVHLGVLEGDEDVQQAAAVAPEGDPFRLRDLPGGLAAEDEAGQGGA